MPVAAAEVLTTEKHRASSAGVPAEQVAADAVAAAAGLMAARGKITAAAASAHRFVCMSFDRAPWRPAERTRTPGLGVAVGAPPGGDRWTCEGARLLWRGPNDPNEFGVRYSWDMGIARKKAKRMRYVELARQAKSVRDDILWLDRRSGHLRSLRLSRRMTLDDLAEWETIPQARAELAERTRGIEWLVFDPDVSVSDTKRGYGQPSRVRGVVSGGLPGLGKGL